MTEENFVFMKIKYLKLKNWLLISLAGVLGVNVSCDQMTEEYGCPMADFNVKGKVTDADGNAIRGIKVEMDYYCDATDANAYYSVRANSIPGDVSRFDVYFADIDGSENGLFENDTVGVSFTRSELTGGDGHWYEGAATKTLDVTLQLVEE